MTVDDQEMLVVEGRLIAPPEIKYISGRDGQSEVVERINIGKLVISNDKHEQSRIFSLDGIFEIVFKKLEISIHGLVSWSQHNDQININYQLLNNLSNIFHMYVDFFSIFMRTKLSNNRFRLLNVSVFVSIRIQL